MEITFCDINTKSLPRYASTPFKKGRNLYFSAKQLFYKKNMEYLKNIYFILITYLSYFNFVLVKADINTKDSSIYDNLIETVNKNNILESDSTWLSLLDEVFFFIKNSISDLIMLISISVFLYIWIKLVISRWNPEEFKKGIMHFVYAIIWIVIISISWAAVKLVSWINI